MEDFKFVPIVGLVCQDSYLNGICEDYQGNEAVIEYVGPDYFVLRPKNKEKNYPLIVTADQYWAIEEVDFK